MFLADSSAIDMDNHKVSNAYSLIGKIDLKVLVPEFIEECVDCSASIFRMESAFLSLTCLSSGEISSASSFLKKK